MGWAVVVNQINREALEMEGQANTIPLQVTGQVRFPPSLVPANTVEARLKIVGHKVLITFGGRTAVYPNDGDTIHCAVKTRGGAAFFGLPSRVKEVLFIPGNARSIDIPYTNDGMLVLHPVAEDEIKSLAVQLESTRSATEHDLRAAHKELDGLNLAISEIYVEIAKTDIAAQQRMSAISKNVSLAHRRIDSLTLERIAHDRRLEGHTWEIEQNAAAIESHKLEFEDIHLKLIERSGAERVLTEIVGQLQAEVAWLQLPWYKRLFTARPDAVSRYWKYALKDPCGWKTSPTPYLATPFETIQNDQELPEDFRIAESAVDEI